MISAIRGAVGHSCLILKQSRLHFVVLTGLELPCSAMPTVRSNPLQSALPSMEL